MDTRVEPEVWDGYAQLDGVRLHYAECGHPDNELVLLLHGFPEFWFSWRHQLPVLGREFHVVAPDLRGYNLSDKPSRVEDYRMEALVADVVGLIKHFRATKAVVVGHDWGAGVAWAVAQHHPELVSKVVAMQVPPAAVWRANNSFRQLRRSWYMFLFQLPRIPEWMMRRNNYESIDTFSKRSVRKGAFSAADIERYKEAIQQPGALTAAINYYRANVKRIVLIGRKDKVKRERQRISMPALFILGEQDFAILPETARGVGDYVGAPYREVRIPDSGHWVQNEAVDEVNQALLDFLKSN